MLHSGFSKSYFVPFPAISWKQWNAYLSTSHLWVVIRTWQKGVLGAKGQEKLKPGQSQQQKCCWNHSGGGGSVTPLKCTSADMLGWWSKARLSWKQGLWMLQPTLCHSGELLAACPQQNARDKIRFFQALGEASCNHWACRNELLL